jgi:hypothetical protein
MLRGDVVNERLDNILNGGGVFDLGRGLFVMMSGLVGG